MLFILFPGISAVSISIFGALVLVGGIEGWSVLTSEGVLIISTPLEWVWAVAPSNALNSLVIKYYITMQCF